MNSSQAATYREDYDLAVKMKRGDETALLTFTRKHQNFVYGWAKSRLRDHRDAEDLRNKIFAETWRYLIPRWDAKHRVFTTYFKRFVRWHINNEVKRLKIAAATRAKLVYIDAKDSPVVLVEKTTPEDVLASDIKGEAIDKAIDKAIEKVKVKDKRVKMRCWRLRNKKGMLAREIAKVTGLSSTKVSGFICEINMKLRDLLDYETLMNLEV